MLKERFREAQYTLLVALNGLHGAQLSDAALAELRLNLMLASQACEHQGIEAETVWEYGQKCHALNEAHVRHYAEEQSKVTPVLSHVLRRRMALAVGLFLAVVVLLKWTTLGGILGALIASFIAFTIVEALLADLFPTPPIRIARKACELGVDVSDLWPKGSVEDKDYVRGTTLHCRRMALRGKARWIKAR